MSFWDNVKKFAQPYSDDDYDDYDEEYDDYEEEAEQEPAPRTGRRPSPFASADSSYESSAPAAPAANRQEIIAAVAAVLAEELGTEVSGLRILSFKKIS